MINKSTDIPVELDVDGVRRFQWLRNREGRQGFGTQTVYVPLNEQIFQKYVHPRLREDVRVKLTTLNAFLTEWPEDTHAEFYSSEGRWEWKLTRVGPPKRLLPRDHQLFYAEEVCSFESDEARQWGAKADSDLYPDDVRALWD